MRIGIGTSFQLENGGVNSYIKTLKSSLNKRNHQTTLIQNNDRGINLRNNVLKISKLFRNIDESEFKIKYTKNYLLDLQKKTKQLISKNNIELIHAQDILFARSIYKEIDIPIVLTVHGPASREALAINQNHLSYHEYLVSIEKEVYQNVNHIIAVDTEQKNIIVNDYNINPDKISVLLNAVDTDLFKPLENTTNENYYLVPRRLVPKNGVVVAIKAFLEADNIESQLWIAGSGSEEETLKRYVKQNNLLNKVKFLGSIDQEKMIKLINKSKGIIVPSIPYKGVVEASSISALEGMSTGKIVIASNIGGLAEIIKDGYNGILFEANNHLELAKILKQTENDVSFYNNIGPNARNTVLNNFSNHNWIEQVTDIYKKVL
jgi:glycosyltransferase involved in cell wall biosynthesis